MKKKLSLPTGKNCFGSRELLAGQSLVPEPPAIIRQSLNITFTPMLFNYVLKYNKLFYLTSEDGVHK